MPKKVSKMFSIQPTCCPLHTHINSNDVFDFSHRAAAADVDTSLNIQPNQDQEKNHENPREEKEKVAHLEVVHLEVAHLEEVADAVCAHAVSVQLLC